MANTILEQILDNVRGGAVLPLDTGRSACSTNEIDRTVCSLLEDLDAELDRFHREALLRASQSPERSATAFRAVILGAFDGIGTPHDSSPVGPDSTSSTPRTTTAVATEDEPAQVSAETRAVTEPPLAGSSRRRTPAEDPKSVPLEDIRSVIEFFR
ncbi:MAG: hypothetical protein KDC38_14075 [Planctomycetes bacterium]|nr:hypothetical protein [Planctomycetota bacterium]